MTHTCLLVRENKRPREWSLTFMHGAAEHGLEDRASSRQNCPVNVQNLALCHDSGVSEQALMVHLLHGAAHMAVHHAGVLLLVTDGCNTL